MKAEGLKSADWQLSADEFGTLVQGVDDIMQCVRIILETAKRSDPLRPEFGTNIYKYIDQPGTLVAPKIVQEIVDGITTWEPRVTLKSVSYTLQGEHVIYNISFTIGVSSEEVLYLQKVRFTNNQDDSGPGGIGYWIIGFNFAVS